MILRTAALGAVILLLGVALSGRANAQATSSSADLFGTLAARDSALFDAFNRCDVKAFEAFFTEDLEFYHDFNGLSSPRAKTIQEFAEECAAHRLGRRELVQGSLEVHPIRGYGAIQIGVHRFFVRSKEGETPGSVARFIHVWTNSDGTWKITRVLSYDHRR